jgi:uncharacterized protein (TIGR03435 family)
MRRVLPSTVTLTVMLVGSSAFSIGLPAQVPAGAAFEAVSIREARSESMSFTLRQHPSGLTATSATALDLIRYAFEIIDADIVGELPGWAGSRKFDIVARSSGEPLTYSRLRAMSRVLLEDRFRLDASYERAEVPVFALVPARSDGRPGPNLRPSVSKCARDPLVQEPSGQSVRVLMLGDNCAVSPISNSGGLTGLAGARVSMQQIARALSKYGRFERPVVDQTGLAGEFDVMAVVSPDIQGATGAARFLTAMQEQLGLTLRGQQGTIDVFRIRRIEQPSPN